LALTALLLTGLPARAEDPSQEAPPEALREYVARTEPKYQWKLRGIMPHDQGQYHDLWLVSQEWHGIVWEHQLQVYHPKGTHPAATMLLWNQGGSASEKNVAFGFDLAQRVGAPVAILYGIPNQPLFDGKKEDALIAETFVRYLDSGDASWPLLFPMAKSLVKAMDALQEYARQEWQLPLEGFVVSGGSKRGWTSWLTAAADGRVRAIAPLVIDTLNMKAQMPHQLESFGAYSEQIHDYTERGLVPMPDTPAARRLWRMVDPWSYRKRLTLPKILINGANDPYWTTDALNLYWDDLSGDKWVVYVPNAGHGLEQQHADGRKDRERALSSLAAFTRHVVKRNPLPEMLWTHNDQQGKARLSVSSNPAPLAARGWLAQSPTRDFRKSEWVELPLTATAGALTLDVERKPGLFRAFFAELEFEIDGVRHPLSTQMRILPPAE
jgi:PhoPQ-activated pathogenicity-related protein